MTTTTHTARTAVNHTDRTQLPRATYTIGGQKRALFTVNTGESLTLMDVPASLLDIAAAGHQTPDSYLVEDSLPQDDAAGELNALLADYLAVAERHHAIPMTVFAMTPELQAHAA